jgi:2-methylcitrate dehydratase
MANIAENLASYGTHIKYEDIPPETVHKAKGLLIDTLGCAIGAYSSEPSKIARKLASQVKSRNMKSTVLGSGQKSTPEMATFANGVMMRFLDFNDGYTGKGVCHPSDTFAPVLTCADACKASGKDVITASILAYEVFCRIIDQIRFIPLGFDQPVPGVIAGVMGASRILGLNQKQMLQAVNIAVSGNIALAQTRVGNVSMWKGCAMADASRNAVFAALLAKEGMSGPESIFEGSHGFFKGVSGPFQLEPFGGGDRPFRIMNTVIKRYPCGLFAQSAIDAALLLRSKISGPDEIAHINIGTFTLGKTVMAGDNEKWQPKTRESADHSMPYAVGVALMYGSADVGHFDETYLEIPELLDLIGKITVDETEECNNLYPDALGNRLELVTGSGEKFSELVAYHRGHHQNPMTDEEIEQKFISLTKDLLSPFQTKTLFHSVWNLEQIDDVGKIMSSLMI